MAERLHNLKDVSLVTVYRHIRRPGILAMQFSFNGGENYFILSEVCSVIGLEFNRVLNMGKRGEYLPYSRKFFSNGEQMQLSMEGKS